MLFISFNYSWMYSALLTTNFMKICIFSVKTCARVDVGHATPNPNTASYNYNTDVTYTCDQAYNHTAGDLVRTCNSSAEWTGTLPTCTGKYFDIIITINREY